MSPTPKKRYSVPGHCSPLLILGFRAGLHFIFLETLLVIFNSDLAQNDGTNKNQYVISCLISNGKSTNYRVDNFEPYQKKAVTPKSTQVDWSGHALGKHRFVSRLSMNISNNLIIHNYSTKGLGKPTWVSRTTQKLSLVYFLFMVVAF